MVVVCQMTEAVLELTSGVDVLEQGDEAGTVGTLSGHRGACRQTQVIRPGSWTRRN